MCDEYHLLYLLYTRDLRIQSTNGECIHVHHDDNCADCAVIAELKRSITFIDGRISTYTSRQHLLSLYDLAQSTDVQALTIAAIGLVTYIDDRDDDLAALVRAYIDSFEYINDTIGEHKIGTLGVGLAAWIATQSHV
jgi:hypothetical protein